MLPNVLVLIWPLFIAPADWSQEELYFFYSKNSNLSEKGEKKTLSRHKKTKKQGKKIKTLIKTLEEQDEKQFFWWAAADRVKDSRHLPRGRLSLMKLSWQLWNEGKPLQYWELTEGTHLFHLSRQRGGDAVAETSRGSFILLYNTSIRFKRRKHHSFAFEFKQCIH